MLFSVLLGGIMCLCYDLIRALRKVGFDSFAYVFISDIIFWISGAIITFIFLIARTNGEIRGYVIISEFLGFIIFRFTVSKAVFPCFVFVFAQLKKFSNFCTDIINVFFNYVEEVAAKFWSYIVKFLKMVQKSIKKLLKSRDKVVYTNENNVSLEYALDETKTKT